MKWYFQDSKKFMKNWGIIPLNILKVKKNNLDRHISKVSYTVVYPIRVCRIHMLFLDDSGL